MAPYRLSQVGLSVIAALSVGHSTLSFAQDSTTSTSQDDTTEVVTVIGSQVELGDAYEGGQVATTGRAGMLGNLDTMDTSFSSTNYTQELIENQQAQSVADVLQNDPTVRVSRGFGNFQELYMIRGFNVYSDDMTLNGIYGIVPRQFIAAEMIERVEVSRGASAFLNGASVSDSASAIGGSVNIVPKRAKKDPLTRVTVGTETGGQAYGALDFGRRFGDDQENGIRVNVVGRNGETSVEDQDRELGVISIGFDHSGERFRFSADAGYQDHHIDSPRASVLTSSATAIPSAPDASENFVSDWTYTDEKQLFGVIRGEYDISSDTTVWLATGARKGKEHNVLEYIYATDSDFSNYTTWGPWENVREDEIFSADTGIRHQLETGSIGHTLVLSGSYYTLKSKNATTYGGDLDNPLVTNRNKFSGIAASDTLSLLNDDLLVTLGARFQQMETNTYDYDTGASDSKYNDSAISPYTGIVYKPSDSISLYANYAEALTPGTTVSGTYSNSGKTLDPYVSTQVETGIKYDNIYYGGTFSLFRTNKASQQVVNNTVTQDGEQINQGAELTVFGMPIENVKVLGGVTYTDAELSKTSDGSNEGKTAISVPEIQANLNLEWATPFVEGLTLEQRTVYTGSQYADEANTLKVPSWTRFDLGARYSMKLDQHDVTLRARVENVLDKDYWASAGGYPGSGYLVLGNPRTVVISASYDF